MTQHITFINPQLKINLDDTFTTGIIYMPFLLNEALSIAETNNISSMVIDLFGEGVDNAIINDNNLIVGKSNAFISKKLKNINETNVVLFANQVINHSLVKSLCIFLKKNKKVKTLSILENSEAVTSYSIKYVDKEFYNLGVDYLIYGDLEKNFKKYLSKIIKKKNISNIRLFLERKERNINRKAINNNLFMSWDKFPIDNYWKLKFAHGPLSSERYLPLLTSKGCPYPCAFCVMPELSKRIWRTKDAEIIFDEMCSYYDNFKVGEFHIEDTNPTINIEKFVDLSKLIQNSIYSGLFIWKFVSGTKVETFKNEKIVQEMAKGGMKYVSFSPESGSFKIRKKIGKKFNIQHSLDFIKWCKKSNVKTQACFVLGFPDENIYDIIKSFFLVCRYTFRGIDEIAVFIITPIPGSELFKQESFSYNQNNDNFSFSPTWRIDYNFLFIWRLLFYFTFLLLKFIFHPINFLKNIFAITGLYKFQNLKMEAAPIRSKYYKKIINGAKNVQM